MDQHQGGQSLGARQEREPTSELHDFVARIVGGEPQAEVELVERFGRGLMSILNRHTGGRPEAEDLYQEAFCIALEKLRRGELRDPSRLPGFLSQLARNLAIDYYRKTKRRKTEADSDAIQEASIVPSSQLNRVLRDEQALLVRQVIEELRNERDRQLLMRFYIAEEDKSTIATDLGLSSLQFNRVLHRARQRYKELYAESASGHGGPGHSLSNVFNSVFFYYLICRMLNQSALDGTLLLIN